MHKRYALLFAGALALGACDKDNDVKTLPDPGSNSTAPTTGASTPSAQGPTTQPGGGGTPTSGVDTRVETTTPSTSIPSSSDNPSTSTTGGSSTSSQSPRSTTTNDQSGSTEENTDTKPEPKKRIRWTKGHGDIRIDWDFNRNALVAKIVVSPGAVLDGVPVPEGDDVVMDPDNVVAVTSNSFTRGDFFFGPEYDPTCLAKGATMSFLSGSNIKDPPSPFYGFANYIPTKAPVKDRVTNLEFLEVKGPGATPHLAIWSVSGGSPSFLISTCEGPAKSTTMERKWGHGHYNMGFSGGPVEGVWELSLKARAQHTNGTPLEVDFPLHFEFIKAP